MKLGARSCEDLAQTLCRLAPPLCRMAKDPKVSKALEGIRGEDPLLVTLGRVGEVLVPCLAEEHLTEMLTVISILTETPAAEIRTRNGRDTVRQFLQCVDEVLADFFPSADGSMKGTSFGGSSAQPV